MEAQTECSLDSITQDINRIRTKMYEIQEHLNKIETHLYGDKPAVSGAAPTPDTAVLAGAFLALNDMTSSMENQIQNIYERLVIFSKTIRGSRVKYSYSSLATYKQCPAKFEYAYITKPEVARLPPSPAMERGSLVHKSVENFFKGSNEFLHPDIHRNYGQFMFSIREEGGDIRPEWKWGITWEFKPCDYNAPDCMLHGYMDLLVIPEADKVIDLYEWKTGGKYDEHRDQGWTYSVAIMCHFPDHPGVDSTITYFDKVDYSKIHYATMMMNEYKPMLRDEIGGIVDATMFPKMPSFKCKWCQFSRHNRGPCQF